MYIRHIRLMGFRNYEDVRLTLSPGVSVFAGNNGQGKTNLLEAVYLCCTGRSHRTSKDREMVRFSGDTAYVEAECARADGTHTVQMAFSSKEKGKRVRINGAQIKRIGELMGHLSGVLFSPEDLRIVKEGPSERRRFVDIMLSQIRPAYFFALQSYQRALLQRNRLLKQASAEVLPEFTEQLAVSGTIILKYRYEFLEKLRPMALENHRYLSGGLENLGLRYVSQFDSEVTPERIVRLMDSRLQDDMRHGTTSVGPHRDDVLLAIDGMDLRSYGSQGQQRTAALSLKLSEHDLMKKITGEAPVLMLDDVMSELDPARKRLLLDRLDGVQTLITCTDKNEAAGTRGADFYHVSNGVISPV